MQRHGGLFQVGASIRDLPEYSKQFKSYWSGWSRDNNTCSSARNYLTGITLPGKRKNMSRISFKLNLDQNIIQQFITDSPWDADSVMEHNARIMSNNLANDLGVLIVDDTGQGKKGTKSPGVKRQYSGTLGKTGNCQILVGCTYAIPGKTRNADAVYWPTGLSGYLPKEWCENTQRRKEAGIPNKVVFRTKPEIALELLDNVRQITPHQAVTADSGYGGNGDFRKGLRDMKESYVVAITPSDISVVPEDTEILPPGRKVGHGRRQIHPNFPKDIHPKTADQMVKDLSDKDWERIEWSEGTKGKLSAQFARIRVRVASQGRPTDEVGWLVFERTRDEELKVFMCWGLDGASLEDLVKIAHIRWTIEQCFKQMKGELGLDDFEGRKWEGWHHHMAMVIIAFCYLMSLRVGVYAFEGKLPTLPRIRREVAYLHIRKIYEQKFSLTTEEADDFLEEYPVLIPE